VALRFYGKGNPVDQCPAVFVDFEYNRILFQGDVVTDPVTLAEIMGRGPLQTNELVVALPPRMAAIILEAAREFLGANPESVQQRFEGEAGPVGRSLAGDQIFFRGETITDVVMLAEIAAHSPMLPTESVVALTPRMMVTIWEAAREFLAANADIVQRPVEGQPEVRPQAGVA